tara:strand:- start:1045 stop:1890 length:846 start_codon:yes stop_codon:yes gene_type:complete
MKTKIFITSICLFIGCANTNKEYLVNGVVHDIKIDEEIIIIDHDSIPGFMMPMIMPFNFKKKEDVENLSSGDSIRFTLVIKPDDSYVANFTILGKSILLADQDDFWDDDEFKSIDIGESLTDIVLLDSKGDSVRISSSDGKFRFISFIFTRCPIPNMCPAVVIKNGVLASYFKKSKNLELIMVSFDYVHDTPAVLNEFYGPSINSYENWRAWSSVGNIAGLYTLSSELGCEFWGVDEGKIGHNLRSALISPNRELLKVWSGDDWLAKDVLKDIESYMTIVN